MRVIGTRRRPEPMAHVAEVLPAERTPEVLAQSDFLLMLLPATRETDNFINAPPRLVFEAWTRAERFQRWWFPKSLGMTLLVVRDLYPSKEALDEDIASGSTSWNDETFDQLDEFLGSATNRG